MAERPNAFYVGYLALPPGLRWVVGSLVILLLALVALDAWLVAQLQPAAGDGRWADTPTAFTGTLSRTPYPTLRVAESGGVRTYFLVADSKRGAEAVLGSIADGASVRLSGFEIERAAIGMIELAAADVAVVETAPVAEPPREIHGRVTLEGEIVDSKCWLGVMRPGDGHVHKACASVCLRGGIPPMFVSRATDAPPVMLLTRFDGSAVPPEAILEYVADRVRLAGVVEKRGDIYVFKVDLTTLSRVE